MKEDTALVKKNTKEIAESRVEWAGLDGWVRGKVQGLIQELLKEEVTELLGRCRHERRGAVDAVAGSRNGYGKERKLTLGCGTVTVRRPRVRGLEERFESRILPLFARRTREVNNLLPELYLHGLAHNDFDMALRGLLGKDAPISGSTVARLKSKWQSEYEEWSSRSLADLEVAYLWVDGVYVKAGLEKKKSAVLVVIAGLSCGRKVLISMTSGHRESEESWSEVLRDLRKRGMNAPRALIGDGHLGIWAALRNVFPEAKEQRCWNHRIINILNKLPKRRQGRGKMLLRQIPAAETKEAAEKAKKLFQKWAHEIGCGEAATLIDINWEQMVTFFDFPKDHWIHLRTSNIIESPFASLRLRTNAAKRFKNVDNATAIIFKMLLIAESRFRKLNSPELMKDVFLGVEFDDGIKKAQEGVKDIAA